MTFEIDTIVAPATPAGRSALALIRISGPRARSVVAAMANKVLVDREPALAILKSRAGDLLDEAVVTYFKAPRSYTGEDLVEISCHGNPLIVEEIVGDIVSRGTRLALAGEFTQRALANEKLGIDQVEGLDWVLNSRTLEGARIGLRAKMGQVGASVEALRYELIEVLAELEASLDFSEEEVGHLEAERAQIRLGHLEEALRKWVSAFDQNLSYLRNQTVVLVGRPNSGKSSLFNALIGQEKAIVYDTPGTTRDLVEHEVLVEGRSVNLIDTAGIRTEADEIESLGIERTLAAIDRADAVLWVCDSGSFDDEELLRAIGGKRLTRVHSKIDLSGGEARLPLVDYRVSALTGAGLDSLRLALRPSEETFTEVAPLTSSRQRNLADEARLIIRESIDLLNRGGSMDRVVALVNDCKTKLEEIAGRVSAEDVLASIFSKFCIGK